LNIMKSISTYAIPVIFLLIIFSGIYKNVKVYDVFIDSAKEGIATVLRIMPSLIGLMVAIGVFRASGALDYIIAALDPITSLLGIPSEALPLALLRPISGSASLALVSDIIKTNGPDSFIGRLVSTMMGSTETIFYTLAVYFGAVGIKNIKYTLAAALIADAVSVFASVWICTVMFK
jgi:spore maturation protein B